MSSVSRYVSPIPNNLPRATTTLARLVNLDAILVDGQERRRPKIISDYLAKVRSVAEDCLKCPTYEHFMNALDRFDPEIAELYEAEENIEKCVKRMLKDAASLVSSPAKRSSVGEEGPTFLVSYPRSIEKTKGYVVKWTNSNELCTHELYRQCGTLFDHPTEGVGFLTPRVVELLSLKDAAALKKNVEVLLKSIAPGTKPQNAQVMVSERILGENFLDFVATKYRYLSFSQKEKLFMRLARLALLDVIVGNLDRFIKIVKWSEAEPFSLETLAGNLGNIMLVWQPEMKSAPIIYAIDNTIEQSLIDNGETCKQYNQFLEKLCSKREIMVSQLKKHMIASFISAANSEMDDCEGDAQELQENRKLFLQDLRTIAPAAIEEGMHQMIDYLQQRLIPDWNNSQKGKELREDLQKRYPQLYDSLAKRFHTFTIFMEASYGS